jgi:small subunit ribosomal protein S2
MSVVSMKALLETGVHFGHRTQRWNPKMKPFIFMERNGIHIIDLKKSQEMLESACNAILKITGEGKRLLFVGTKKQAKDVVKEEAIRSGQNYVTERWLGGMLTNFTTIRRSIKRLTHIEKMESDGTFESITKKERLMLTREKEKLEKVLSGIVDMSRLPGAIFVVDINKEHIAVQEARRLNVPVVAILDTNCDPDFVDIAIPANDDAMKCVQLITHAIADAAIEGREKAKLIRAEKEAEEERIEKQNEPMA